MMDILSFVAIIGALQGFIILLSIFIRFKHRKNMPLVLLLIIFSMRLVTIPTWNPNMLLRYPCLLPITTPLPYLFGLFLWWYIRELVNDTPNVPGYLFLHFLPYIFDTLVVSIILLTMSNGEYKLFIQDIFLGNPPLWMSIRNVLKVVSNIIYIFLSIRLAFGKACNRLSKPKRIWLRFLIIISSIVLISFAYVAMVPETSKNIEEGFPTPFFILSTTMAVLIYSISLLLLIAPDVSLFKFKLKERKFSLLYPKEECEYLVSLVKKRLSEGAYYNPDLMLTDLATEFKVHPNRLSFAINHCCNMSFKTLLNTSRLDYFSTKIDQGALQNQSILELAFEAGFPSKSTFNRIFREKMGMSPTQYVKHLDTT